MSCLSSKGWIGNTYPLDSTNQARVRFQLSSNCVFTKVAVRSYESSGTFIRTYPWFGTKVILRKNLSGVRSTVRLLGRSAVFTKARYGIPYSVLGNSVHGNSEFHKNYFGNSIVTSTVYHTQYYGNTNTVSFAPLRC